MPEILIPQLCTTALLQSAVQSFGKYQDLYLTSFKGVSHRKYALPGRKMRGPGWNGPLSLRMILAEAAAHHSTPVKNFLPLPQW
ncbi:MAG: hypothetical protein NTW32_14025 [Chloroflexi bacterium]|nr:hypothetical protein [Chloroflexota bacterium]